MINLLAYGIRSNKNSNFEDSNAVKYPAIYDPVRIRHRLEIGKSPNPQKSSLKYTSANNDEMMEWTALYGEERTYYDGWSREEVESGLSDAFEGDTDALWNID